MSVPFTTAGRGPPLDPDSGAAPGNCWTSMVGPPSSLAVRRSDGLVQRAAGASRLARPEPIHKPAFGTCTVYAGSEIMVLDLMKSSAGNDYHLWRFVTNHAHVLACIAADPSTRLRDIAATVGVTERTAGQIVSELEQAGYLTK